MSGLYTIFDTSSPDIGISKVYFDNFVEELMATQPSLSYQFADGYLMSQCTDNWPSIFFNMEGKYLEVAAKDYVKDVSAAQDKSLCKVFIRPLDAPFNIMGLPIYMDYYVTHGNDTMSFTPYFNAKAAIETGKRADKTLAAALETEDTANGDAWAFGIAFFLTLCLCGVLGIVIWYEYGLYQAGTQTVQYLVGLSAGSFVGAIISFFILQWVLLLVLMPGNKVYDVEDPDTAIAKVYNSRLGLVGIVGLIAAYFGKKQQPEKKVVSAEAALDKLVNNLE